MKIGKGKLYWEGPKQHYVPGVIWWPGLDEKGNTRDSVRVLRLPRWLFKNFLCLIKLHNWTYEGQERSCPCGKIQHWHVSCSMTAGYVNGQTPLSPLSDYPRHGIIHI
jgi:hypothetical protein